MSPRLRKRIAGYLFWAVLAIGAWLTWTLPPGAYERILLGISFLALNLTLGDIWLTTDVRNEQDT